MYFSEKMLKSSEKGCGEAGVHRITHTEMLMISKSQEVGRRKSLIPSALVNLIPGLTFSSCLFCPARHMRWLQKYKLHHDIFKKNAQ